MRSKRDLWKICVKAYTEMFKKAKPSLDFRKVYRKALGGRTTKQGWFMKFYLPEDEQEEIIGKYIKRNKLDRRESKMVSVELHLGCAPTSVRESWIEAWGGEEPKVRVFREIDELFEEAV